MEKQQAELNGQTSLFSFNEGHEKALKIEGGAMGKSGAVAVVNLPIKKIKLARNSRMSVAPDELDGLMQSIKEVGLLQPIGVVRRAKGYEVCYGNRRFLACDKLGLTKIPCIVHENKTEFDVDIKNLTENIQRRNLSLPEIGRYMELLKSEGLTSKEVAVRLGVTNSYVQACVGAFNGVPKEFQKDLEVRITPEQQSTTQKTPGKIGIHTANKIISAAKSYRLNEDEKKELFKAAKSDDRFVVANVTKYASAIKQGKKPLETVKPIKQLAIKLLLEQDYYDELMDKFITNGPFNSITHLALEILKGKKHLKMKLLDRHSNF